MHIIFHLKKGGTVLNADTGGNKPETKDDSIEKFDEIIGIDTEAGGINGMVSIDTEAVEARAGACVRFCGKDTKSKKPESDGIDGSVGSVSSALTLKSYADVNTEHYHILPVLG